MTPRDELLRLAERCEAATAGDLVALSKLNADILRSLGWTSDDHNAYDPAGIRALSIPSYVTSVDAAITPVPEGVGGEAMNASAGRVNEGNGRVRGLASVSDSLCGPAYTGLASTPTLALCAASLRARAQVQP